MTETIVYPYYLEFSERYRIVLPSSNYLTTRPIVYDKHREIAFDLQLDCQYKHSYFIHGVFEAFQISPKLLLLRLGNNHYKVDDEFKRAESSFRTSRASGDTTYPTIETASFEGYKLLYEKMKKRGEVPDVNVPRQLKPLSMYAKGLDIVLQDRPTDFTITCNDSGSFPVHSFLLTNLWPFFSTASTVEMIEKDTQTLHLPFPKSCVEILVAFFYGKDVEAIDWDSSVLLLQMSSLYDIPELKKYATESLVSSTELLTLARALKEWKVANESDAFEVETFLTPFLKTHASKIEDSEESKDLTESQLLELLLQVVRV